MTLRHPEFLWLIIPVALLILVAALRGRRVALPAAFVRLLAVSSVVVAIAGPVTAYEVTGKSVVFVVDRSGSIPQSATASQARFINDTIDHLASGTRAGVVAFGGKATIVYPPGNTPHDVSRITSDLTEANIDRDHTNIAAGIRLARALLARGGGGQVFLLSDGQENTSDARAESEAAANDGVRISPVKTDNLAFPPDVRVASMDMPETVWGGDQLPIHINLTGNNPWQGNLHLSVDGAQILDPPVAAPDGNTGFVTTLPALPSGTHVVTARVEVTQGENQIPENDRLSVVTTVRGKPNVLLLEGTSGEGSAVHDALTAQGVNVTVKTPKEIPPRLSQLGETDAIVLVDVSAKDLSLDQMATIQQAVRANGKGLVVIGGANAYGAGNYQQTPLEEALPVSVNFVPGNQIQQKAILVIIDKSGSMDEDLGSGGPKVAAARTAAVTLAHGLPPGTIFGLDVFSDATTPLVPLQPIPTELRGIDDTISRVKADGGTDIYGAIKQGIQQMRGVVATEKHIVLMTDGGDNKFNNLSDYQALLNQLNADDVTFSTLGIGGDADVKLLQGMADAGKGTYYYVNDAKDLPQITLRAVDEAGRQQTVRGTFHPTQQEASPILTDIRPEELPNLDGYAATKVKNGAQVVLDSGKHDPVLAAWQYGLGRVVAWTPDTGPLFAKQWPGWGKFGQFWHQALLWSLPDPNTAALTVDTHAEGDQVIIGVDATDVDGRFVNSIPVMGTLVTPDGKSFAVRLPQVGPGRYEVHVQAAAPGAYRLTLAQQRPGSTAVQRDGGFAVPYSAEYSPAPGGTALLSDIATLTGGSVLANSGEATDAGGKAGTITRFHEWWGWFAIAALVLFLADLGLRLSLAPNRRRAGQVTRVNRLLTRARRPPRRAPARKPPPSLR